MREFGIASIVLLMALNSVAAPGERTGGTPATRVRVAGDDATPLDQTLRVLTLNTFMRPPPVGWGDRNTCRGRQIGRRLAGGPDARDIVVLNETFDDVGTSALTQAAARRFPYRLIGLPGAYNFRTNGGVSILSRYPIETWNADRFRQCSGQFNDCMATKGFVWARIRVSNHLKVNVVATHLNSGGSPGARQTRRAQLSQIRQFMASRSDFDRWPTLLMGDLNLNGLRWSPRADASQRLTEYGQMMRLLGNECTTCTTADCRASCRPYPRDIFRHHHGQWSFDADDTDSVNTYNCTDQRLRPCHSPNRAAHWKERLRIDYLLDFGPPPMADNLDIRTLASSTVAFRSDVCGTTYLSDHRGVAATVQINRNNTPASPVSSIH